MKLPWTPAELSARLSRRVDRIETVHVFEARDASDLLRLRLHGDLTPALQTVILKRWTGTALRVSSRAELRFQQQFAPAMHADFVPELYAAHHDHEDAWLLMQDLSRDYAHPSLPFSAAQLEAAVDVLSELHGFWWQHPRLEESDLFEAIDDVTRMPQALTISGIERNARRAETALETFRVAHESVFSRDDWRLLEAWLVIWPRVFAERTANSAQVTLLHGDFHLPGNTFFTARDAQPMKVIDWAQHKRGLGAHDLAYALLSATDENRLERDEVLMRRYQAGLERNGVQGYTPRQCRWDYRFCLVTNLFQAVFHNSPRWLRRNLDVVRIWGLEDWMRTL